MDMAITGTNTIQSIILLPILESNLTVMLRKYKSIIVKVPGIKVKGDDTSGKMSDMISDVANDHAKQGWKLLQVIPALIRDGALQKVIITMEKKMVNR